MRKKKILLLVETENTAYKTRVDNLQDSFNNLENNVRELDALYHVSINKLFDGNMLNMPLARALKQSFSADHEISRERFYPLEPLAKEAPPPPKY